VDVDEARRVLERLERIERLTDGGGSRQAILAELEKLVEEGEAWLAAEPGGADEARHALERCRCCLERRGEAVPATA
jgi:hypothetical protein